MTDTTKAISIVLDLDDVLANLRECLYQTFRRATGIDRPWRDWPHYDLGRHFNLDKTALEALLLREQVLRRCEPEPEAAATTEELRACGYHVAIVTARGWCADARTVTADWLRRHGVAYDSLHIVPLGGDKMDAITDLAEVRLAVDDHPHNIRRYSDAGLRSLLVDMPWNRDAAFRDMRRIRSLAELREHARRAADP